MCNLMLSHHKITHSLAQRILVYRQQVFEIHIHKKIESSKNSDSEVMQQYAHTIFPTPHFSFPNPAALSKLPPIEPVCTRSKIMMVSLKERRSSYWATMGSVITIEEVNNDL